MIGRFATGVVMAAGLALSLAGCLGEAGDKVDEAGQRLKLTAAQALGKTAENTGQIDSFKADLSMRLTGSSGAVVTTNGEVQHRSKPDLAYRLTLNGMTIADRRMDGGEKILFDGYMYFKLPPPLNRGGKPWIAVSLDEVGKKAGINLDALFRQSQQLDPVQNTKLLTASKDAREVGRENVDGVKTTHYTGTFRIEDAVAKLPPESRELYRGGMAEAGTQDKHFDVWVDDQQLPRKLVVKPQRSAPEHVTIRYRDFGEPVRITAPPASQVIGIREWAESFGDLLGS